LLIIEILERIKRSEPKKDATDRRADGPISRRQGIYGKTPSGASFVKDAKVSNPTKTVDLKDVECFICHKKGHYVNKCPDAKDGNGHFKVRQLEEPSNDKKDEKAIRQIRICHSDVNCSDPSILDQAVRSGWAGSGRATPWSFGTYVR